MKKAFLFSALLCILLLTDKGITLIAAPRYHAAQASQEELFCFNVRYEDGTKVMSGWVKIGGTSFRIIDGQASVLSSVGHYFGITDDNNPSLRYAGLIWFPNQSVVNVVIPNK